MFKAARIVQFALIAIVTGVSCKETSGPNTIERWDYGDDLGYSFHNLPIAQYTLRAAADGYDSAEIRATPSNPYQYTTMIVLKKK